MKTTRTLVHVLLLFSILAILLVFQNETSSFLLGLRDVLRNVTSSSCDIQKIRDIEAENKSLKKQVELLSLQNGIKKSDGELIAHVYSSYPFSDKVRIIIDKGSNDGVRIGMPVMAKEQILIGKVIAVQGTQSEVQTLFDSEWKSSVVIGASSTKAVVKGGNVPEIQFIPKDAALAPSDQVLNITKDFPMHALVGSVKSVHDDEKKMWKIATLEVPVLFEDLQSVIVLTKFP